jgi:hypothetical protein
MDQHSLVSPNRTKNQPTTFLLSYYYTPYNGIVKYDLGASLKLLQLCYAMSAASIIRILRG